MLIEIWSDIICPWCGLGSQRLQMALADLPERGQIEIVYRSYMLDPNPARKMWRPCGRLFDVFWIGRPTKFFGMR